ncbi:unnamed protein product [Pieris macdunnoughi]|uniref:Uncharacterized protein n=1 Tax=Pieris macdunnoughi TaxID=345717 RepID=A0A821PCX9_9NEOP|nr:unnamed protein product [Pieris macdunnoughi]
MGSDMNSGHWEVLSNLLARFEREPKQIIGRRTTSWFLVGEEIFKEFYKLGLTIEWQFSRIESNYDVNHICSQIQSNVGWLQSFISLYPNLKLDFEFACSSDDICQVRSGIDVLLKGFANLNENFDSVLRELTEEGDVEDFDRCLKIWIETGHRPDFLGETNNVFLEHWWWF